MSRGPWKTTRSLIVRFLEKVSIPSDSPTACWEWTGAKLEGYGQIWRGPGSARAELAHRIAWEMANGKCPGDLFVIHSCDNRACVRPSHLRVGTQQENLLDMSRKRRGHRGASDLPLGVYKYKSRWCGRFKFNKKCHYLGTYDSPEEAGAIVNFVRGLFFGAGAR